VIIVFNKNKPKEKTKFYLSMPQKNSSLAKTKHFKKRKYSKKIKIYREFKEKEKFQQNYYFRESKRSRLQFIPS